MAVHYSAGALVLATEECSGCATKSIRSRWPNARVGLLDPVALVDLLRETIKRAAK
jgi:hypothetical protein